MSSSRSKSNPKRDRSGRNLAQYGLFDVPTDLNFTSGADDGGDSDSDLEAELLALAGETTNKPSRPPRQKPVPSNHLSAMVAASMRDIPSDEELSGDDDDPELLNELNQIAGGVSPLPEEASPPPAPAKSTDETMQLLEDRLKMYETAESNARTMGETTRARRFNRGISTLKDLLRQAKAGNAISEDDVPPVISTVVHKRKEEGNDLPMEPVRTAPQIPSAPDVEMMEPEPVSGEVAVEEPSTPTKSVDTELLKMLNMRKLEYKMAALKSKKSGDNQTALNYIKIAKQFDAVISAVENGQPVDLSRMPGPPQEPSVNTEASEAQKAPDDPEPSATNVPSEPNLITANSLEEALQQRLDVYKKQAEAAKEQGNSGKIRRMGRIVKQFEDAIKLQKAGKAVPVDELPTPPGYAPLVVPGAEAVSPAPSGGGTVPTVPAKPIPQSPTKSEGGSVRVSGNHVPNSRAEKQVILLLARQKEFKLAALSAKQKGEVNQAKELLRTAKGFDPLIDAARGGFPVDLSTLPVPPAAKSQLDEDYDIIMKEETTEDDTGDFDLITRLEAQLTKQLKMCLSTRDHYKLLGDVPSTNRFEQIALNVTKDLDIIRLARRTPGTRIPKFHYENKDFSIVKSFTDLGDNDLELTIVRGVNYMTANPKEIDTYVKFEFPFPQDESYRDKTSTVYDTNNPEYNAAFKIPIQRSSRQCLRVFKRHAIKAEVYSKGCCSAGMGGCCFSGLFRGDTLLGTVSVKLQPLETQCELHDSFDLMDGRKKVGGKLEVRLRVRHPMLTKEIEQIHEKWLVLDH